MKIITNLTALPTVVGLLALLSLPLGAAENLAPPKQKTSNGDHTSAGRFTTLNGIKVYFETHSHGPPMLQIHGNGQDISALGHQIKFFSEKYRVVVADSRGHGKSEIGEGRLTYEQMAEDAIVLLEQLGLKQVYVLGCSPLVTRGGQTTRGISIGSGDHHSESAAFPVRASASSFANRYTAMGLSVNTARVATPVL